MRRPVVRFVLTLLVAASIIGSAPATSEAGIVPWAWDTLFGPVGSIQARRAARFGYAGDCGSCNVGYSAVYNAGCCYGPAPRWVGFRGIGMGGRCCGSIGYGSYYGGYSSYGYDGGCSTGGCSTGGCYDGSCGGCSSCGVSGYGYDAGYACGPGGCGTGQCNVNYPPSSPSPVGASPVTPAAPPSANNPNSDAGSPTPYGANPYPNNSTVTPPTTGADTDPGFVPKGTNSRGPAPMTPDPTRDGDYIPPRVNDAATGTETNDGNTTVPAVPPANLNRPRPNFGGEDETRSAPGPRLEMDEKITWQRSIVRVRQAQAPTRVSATANRSGLFPKLAWRSTIDTELAKK